jgi:serine phosphatase RsbU (regulator of sigma subunit)/catechol 2,3-dioxygenase-like lactoylglutathione lyase family enzyme
MENSAQPDRGDIVRDPNAAEFLQPFLRLNFVTVWVRDQERSRRFFVDQLGFQVAVDAEAPGVGRWIIVTPPAGLPGIALVVPVEGSVEVGRIDQNTGVAFLTEDVRALFEEWSKRGVRFELPPTEPAWGRGEARYALFEDVDGNRFSLIEIDEATRALEAERRANAARLEAERQTAHDLAIAKEVQSRLLPQRHPPLQTLACAGLCRPARAVGGDYYDFLHLGKGRLGLVVGDVAGKGIAAALLMANLQATLRSQCATAWEQPQRFLRSVNQLFYDNSAESDYATIFFAEYDDQTRMLRYSNCGHPPAFLLRRDDTLEPLESTSTVIGLFEQWDCAIEERQLYPGDTLMLYTDGATEASNHAGEEFGEERLLEALKQYHELSSHELLAAVTSQVRQFSTHEQADDITIIVAKCT